MASSILIKFTCLVVTCLVLGIPLANASLSCPHMIQTTAPCIEYLANPGPSVPTPCCNGVRALNDEAKTVYDHRDACNCLKPVLINIPGGINDDALTALPDNCGVHLGFKIGLNIDCDGIPNE